MASLTRWVLAHKRTVVVTWVVLTFAGITAAGPASDALEAEFSVPGKEGWETNVEIAERYGGDRNGTAPLMPVVTLPDGRDRRLARRRADLERSTRASSRRCRARGSRLRLDRRRHVRLRGRPHDVRARLPAARPRLGRSARTRRPRRRRARARRGRDASPARPVHLTGFDALRRGQRRRAARARACCSRRCSAASARCWC